MNFVHHSLNPSWGKLKRGWARAPAQLRAFYVEAGNGTAGPFYGLYPAEDLRGYRPADPYPGMEALRKPSPDGEEETESGGAVEADEAALAGLIPVMDCGCGEERCIVTNGAAAGTLVSYADGLLYDTGQTLCKAYEEWLEKETLQFRALEDLMRSGAGYREIREQMDATFDPDVSVGRMIASVANVQLPAELFGDPKEHTIIMHGAAQDPWFEDMLAEWQAENVG